MAKFPTIAQFFCGFLCLHLFFPRLLGTHREMGMHDERRGGDERGVNNNVEKEGGM